MTWLGTQKILGIHIQLCVHAHTHKHTDKKTSRANKGLQHECRIQNWKKLYFYASNEWSKNKTKKIMSEDSIQKIEYLGKILTKETQDLYTKTIKHCSNK